MDFASIPFKYLLSLLFNMYKINLCVSIKTYYCIYVKNLEKDAQKYCLLASWLSYARFQYLTHYVLFLKLTTAPFVVNKMVDREKDKQTELKQKSLFIFVGKC